MSQIHALNTRAHQFVAHARERCFRLPEFEDYCVFWRNMSTHPAVVTTTIHGPLEILYVPTVAPKEGEVRVRVEWTASTPLDLHQNDSGLLVHHPQVLGDGIAGTVVDAGSDLKNLAVGDKVGKV